MNWRPLLLLLFCGLWLQGCAGAFQNSPGKGTESETPVTAQSYRQKALDLERQGELQQALFAWRVVAALTPDDSAVPDIIKTLERGIANAGDIHYKKGVTFYQQGNFSEARREFLIALRLDPEDKRAVTFLKTWLQYPNQKIFKVQRGDSYFKIATEEYNDPSKANIIAAFNDLDPQKPLSVDAVLLLPNLSPDQLVPRKETISLLQKAQKAMDNRRYQEVLAITAKIKSGGPEGADCQALSDSAHFALGNAMMEKKNYSSALEYFTKVSPGFKGREMAIAKAEFNIQQQSTEEKLRTAQESFNQKEFFAAIQLTGEILAQDASNHKAKELSDAAHYALGKRLLDQGQEAKAIEVLSVLAHDYKDTAQLLNQAHARRNALAEEYYRKGVKYFLNEELEQAIASWEQTLILNPNHPKARQDIDNASRLLEKWRGMEQTDKKGND